jgi:hypothetical protein
MHLSHRPTTGQAQRIRHYAGHADSYSMFNLLSGPQLLDRVEALLPNHRERLFPPTETLSMFLAQVMSSDGSCQQVVDDAMVKRVVGGLVALAGSAGASGRRRHGNPGGHRQEPGRFSAAEQSRRSSAESWSGSSW